MFKHTVSSRTQNACFNITYILSLIDKSILPLLFWVSRFSFLVFYYLDIRVGSACD
jgi:hypothetical protein